MNCMVTHGNTVFISPVQSTHHACCSIHAGIWGTVVDVDIAVFSCPARKAHACVVAYAILRRVK